MRSHHLARWLRDARTFPSDARAAWQRERLGGVWRELRGLTLGRVFRVSRFLVIENDVAEGLETPPPPGVSIERFTGDWEALAGIAGAPRRARFREATERGRVCFLARRGERPIGYTWLTERPDGGHDPAILALPPGTAYLTELYVVPAERNAGVGSALVSARRRYARERGFAKTWQMVAPRNTASLRVVAKTTRAPARVVAEVRIRRLLGWWRVRVLPVVTATAPGGLPRAEPARLHDSIR